MPFWNRLFGRKQGKGLRRKPEGYAQGPGGQCVCPNCGTKVPHTTDRPCYELNCPNCGQKMTRENV